MYISHHTHNISQPSQTGQSHSRIGWAAFVKYSLSAIPPNKSVPWYICFSLQETDKLEDDKTALETEIADLLKEKERLEQILASHQPTCKLSNVDGDIESMLQDPPASPHILSILDHSKLPEGGVALEGPLMQDIEAFAPNISATEIGRAHV